MKTSPGPAITDAMKKEPPSQQDQDFADKVNQLISQHIDAGGDKVKALAVIANSLGQTIAIDDELRDTAVWGFETVRMNLHQGFDGAIRKMLEMGYLVAEVPEPTAPGTETKQ